MDIDIKKVLSERDQIINNQAEVWAKSITTTQATIHSGFLLYYVTIVL